MPQELKMLQIIKIAEITCVRSNKNKVERSLNFAGI